jgi:uncharacterized protein YdaU (DUF1376 family)
MNYYPFNVGDYAAHTAHLEPMEDLAYRRLLDAYYLREGPLPADIQTTAKLVRMRSMMADVGSVLREFFTLTEAGWRHKRCDEEVARMQDKQAKARASAHVSVSVRRAKAQQAPEANAERTLEHEPANAERTLPKAGTDVELPTPTPTPTPEVKEERARVRAQTAAAVPRPEDVQPQTWADWLQLRKAKKAPVTLTVLESARSESVKAGMTLERFLKTWCARGSQGLQADWLRPEERQQARLPGDAFMGAA